MKKILYIDMDNVLVDFESAFEHLSRDTMLDYVGKLDEIPGIFSLMEPMPGAVAAFHTLIQHYDTYILSTAPWLNPSAWSDKLLWVQKHLGIIAYKRLILSHHKNLNDGHFLVDDRTKNGAGDFPGEHLLFGWEPYADWNDVVNYLVNKA